MNKREAIDQLIADFTNSLIAQGLTSIDDIDNDLDRKIAKALKITLAKGIK